MSSKTKRKNRQKRKHRRLTYQYYSILNRKTSEKDRQNDEIMRMENEDKNQKTHQLWQNKDQRQVKQFEAKKKSNLKKQKLKAILDTIT